MIRSETLQTWDWQIATGELWERKDYRSHLKTKSSFQHPEPILSRTLHPALPISQKFVFMELKIIACIVKTCWHEEILCVLDFHFWIAQIYWGHTRSIKNLISTYSFFRNRLEFEIFSLCTFFLTGKKTVAILIKQVIDLKTWKLRICNFGQIFKNASLIMVKTHAKTHCSKKFWVKANAILYMAFWHCLPFATICWLQTLVTIYSNSCQRLFPSFCTPQS